MPRHSRPSAGTAAIEFALILPVFMLLLAGIVDCGIAYHTELGLAATVNATARYAFTQGQSESGSNLTDDVSSFATSLSPVPLTLNVTYNNGQDPSSCFCLDGSSGSYTGPSTCGSTCPDGSGSTAGRFINIVASLTFSPMIPMTELIFPDGFTQSVTVRVQ